MNTSSKKICIEPSATPVFMPGLSTLLLHPRSDKAKMALTITALYERHRQVDI